MKRRRRVREVNLAQVRARSLHLRESWVWVKVRFGVQHAFQCFETTQIFFRFEFRSMCVCVCVKRKKKNNFEIHATLKTTLTSFYNETLLDSFCCRGSAIFPFSLGSGPC